MSVAQSWQPGHVASHTAQFGARWGPSAVVISAAGELDAANSDELTACVQRALRRSKRVVVDLRRLMFIGTAGFSALHRINVACCAAQAHWVVVPGGAVARLLRICDPDGTLPVTTVAAEPLLTTAPAAEETEPLFQLVPQPR